MKRLIVGPARGGVGPRAAPSGHGLRRVRGMSWGRDRRRDRTTAGDLLELCGTRGRAGARAAPHEQHPADGRSRPSRTKAYHRLPDELERRRPLDPRGQRGVATDRRRPDPMATDHIEHTMRGRSAILGGRESAPRLEATQMVVRLRYLLEIRRGTTSKPARRHSCHGTSGASKTRHAARWAGTTTGPWT